MEIPDYLVDEVQRGKVVLLLGAGASLGAKDAHGNEAPSPEQLATMISDRFLGSADEGQPLDDAAELAISESSPTEVQEFIRSKFIDLRPAEFHGLLPTFRWHGLATTNYDLVIESAYDTRDNKLQNLVPFRSNKDRVEDLLRSPNDLPLLKLHGCISRVNDPDTPLILTPDQYVLHRKNRDNLFKMLIEWAYAHPVVFIGHRLKDQDIRQILLELVELPGMRPRYYLIRPSVTEPQRRLWESRRISILDGTFEDFLRMLDSRLQYPLRAVQTVELPVHPIAARFVSREPLSESTHNFLAYEADYVHAALAIEALSPQDFYKGINPGWSAVEQGLDVRRETVDEIITDVFMMEESDRPTKVDFYVIQGEAGAGKTVYLHRLAWDAATQLKRLCLFLKPTAPLRYEPVREVSERTGERIFLFVDNAADHVGELGVVLQRARREGLTLTVLSAERLNEWNMACDRIDPFVTEEYLLPHLSHNEIVQLVKLLETHKSLGYLQSATLEGRIAAFEEVADHQLLVALHETTQGRPFEDILVDEYHAINPLSARSLYLAVCVLNRLRVPVRAGLISRTHEIPFEAFQKELFKPLDHVVRVGLDPVTKDYHYTARHPLIAGIVFERILTHPEDRFNEYVRLLGSMNIAFKADRDAYRRLIRGRDLAELFPDQYMVLQLFRKAEEFAADDAHLFHQQGIYEMRRTGGDLNKAADHLNRARAMAPHDVTIVHSLAELEILRAEKSTVALEREFHRGQAIKLANSIRDDVTSGAYGYHTILKALLGRLRDLLAQAGSPQLDIEVAIREVEGTLELGLQKFPEDEFLLTAEADFRMIVKDNARAVAALEAAFRVNPRAPFIANRLAKAYQASGNIVQALKILEEALRANPAEKQLHFATALLLRQYQPDERDAIVYHLRRSFSAGDQNYEAQFWYAVYVFQDADSARRAESKQIFRQLRDRPVPAKDKRRIRDIVKSDQSPVEFVGRVARLEGSYGFIERDAVGDWIYLSRHLVDVAVWDRLKTGQRVTFNIGFSYGGATALEVRIGR